MSSSSSLSRRDRAPNPLTKIKYLRQSNRQKASAEVISKNFVATWLPWRCNSPRGGEECPERRQTDCVTLGALSALRLFTFCHASLRQRIGSSRLTFSLLSFLLSEFTRRSTRQDRCCTTVSRVFFEPKLSQKGKKFFSRQCKFFLRENILFVRCREAARRQTEDLLKVSFR